MLPFLIVILISFFLLASSFKTIFSIGRVRSVSVYARKQRAIPEHPVAIVTGSSRGIGKAIAIALGEAGCKVVVNYPFPSNEGEALEVCEVINERGKAKGGSAVAIKANVAQAEEVNQMLDSSVEQFGSVDIVVNNAGITRDMLSMLMKPEDFTSVIDVNLNGVFFTAQAAFKKAMMTQRSGRIINIASIVGQIGNPGQANYAASKGGVIAMTKSFAKEFGGRGICVNAVCPGFIDTEMTKDLDKEPLLPLIPLKRFGTPEEVAGLVKFLALDPAAAYITGHCFNVDGGLAIGAT